MATKISESDLLVGDVLLYNGTSFISEMIKLFDGSEYSHAAIYYDNGVLEAISEGVKKRTLDVSTADANYVDVYRFISSSGNGKIGDQDHPAQPLIDQIVNYQKDAERYAYEQILLLALLASTRKISIPLVSWIIRNILDSAAEIVNSIIAMGKEPMICSELVYRCYCQAGDKYTLLISGADLAQKTLSKGQIIKTYDEDNSLNLNVENFLLKYTVSKRMINRSKKEVETIQDMISALAIADFVTPRDLKTSPNLYCAGTLQL